MIIRKEIVFLFFKKLETSWKTERFFKSVKTDKKKSLSSKNLNWTKAVKCLVVNINVELKMFEVVWLSD